MKYRAKALDEALIAFLISAMLHDPELYPNPTAFDPDRYSNHIPQNKDVNADPRLIAFGFGPRIWYEPRPCPECVLMIP